MSRISKGVRFLTLLIVVLLVVTVVLVSRELRQPHDMPDIQGALMQQPRHLEDFTLTDHDGEPFRNADLQGQWHLLSYGFTHCPDICPVTMGVKARLLEQLEQQEQYTDLGLLFYSVDPERDTPEHLSEYVTHFHSDMTGLTLAGLDHEQPEPFEQGLGLIHEIPEDQDLEGNYIVNHGVLVYLLNPEGNLQAYFEPRTDEDGRISFSTERMLNDYLAIRRYLDD